MRFKPNLTYVCMHNVVRNVTRRERTENVCFKAVQKKHAHKNLVYGEPENDKRVPRKIPHQKLVYKKRSRNIGITKSVSNLT